jgi:hypothetical protein
MKEEYLRNMALTARMEDIMSQTGSAQPLEPQPQSPANPEEDTYEAFLQRLEAATKTQVAVLESSYNSLDSRMQSLRLATEKAALSGRFSPDSLFEENFDPEEKQFVLTRLAPDCIIESTSKVEWLLSPGKRIEILAGMAKEDRLKEALRQSLPKPDRFGMVLRRILASPESLRPGRMNQEDLQAVVKVLETLRGLDIPKPRLEDVEPFIQSGTTLSDYSLLSSNFVGRVDELARLYKFLESPNPGPWNGLVVTGIGGVGKSTLLAKFTSEVMEQERATVVIIDFDRPGMNPAETGWLEMEMARQIGDLYPTWRQMLYSIRADLQQRQSAYGLESMRESLHIYKTLVDVVGNILAESDPSRSKPFLLILDTVEEAAQRSLTLPLLDWLFEISHFLNHPLKVIFSGRLYEHQLAEFKANPQVLDIFEMEAFDKNIARKFLRLHGMDKHTAWKLVDLEIMPLRPLELKLMAHLISEGSTTLEELEKDLQGNSGNQATKELFSGLVYRRVLMRIGDPLVRTIAYPGLVLRYVTPQIVQEVLAPALKLGEIGEEQAEQIVEDLRSYSWLAYEKEGALWHSKDLRRTMLRLMILHEPENVQRIRKEAINYFGNKEDAASQAEKVYHQLMMMSGPGDNGTPDRQSMAVSYKFLQSDIADLPRTAAVMLQYAGTGNVNETDAGLLPDDLFLTAYYAIGERLVKNRQFSQAYKNFIKAHRMLREKKSPPKLTFFTKWEYELLFSIVDWRWFVNVNNLKKYDKDNLTVVEDDFFFLQAIIAPSKVNRNEFETLVNKALEKFENRAKEQLAKSEIITTMSRMAYGLASLHTREKLSFRNSSLSSLSLNLAKEFAHTKSALVLQLVNTDDPFLFYGIECSLLKLDPVWMAWLAHIFPHVETPLDVMKRGNLSSTTFLSQVGLAATKTYRTGLQGFDKTTIYEIVRGPDPIFRDPCRYAVLDAFSTYQDYRNLAGYIQQSINVKLTDLEPEQFATRMTQDAETALEIFIEIVDRSWALGDFLRLLHRKKQKAKKIKQVLDVYENWENSFRQLVFGNGGSKDKLTSKLK